jgi:hypothetical protein
MQTLSFDLSCHQEGIGAGQRLEGVVSNAITNTKSRKFRVLSFSYKVNTQHQPDARVPAPKSPYSAEAMLIGIQALTTEKCAVFRPGWSLGEDRP